MLKKIISSSVIILVFFISYVGYADKITNLVKNPSFEDGSSGNVTEWTNFGTISKNASFGISEDEKYSGEKSLLITNTEKCDTMVMQDIAIEKGKIYKISCWVKTDGIEQQAGSANLSIFYVSNGFDTKGIFTSREMMNTKGEWKRIELFVKTRSDIDEPLKLALRLGGQGVPNKGKAYFDDVEVVMVDQPGKGDYFVFKEGVGQTSNDSTATTKDNNNQLTDTSNPKENINKQQNDSTKYVLYASVLVAGMICIVAIEYLVRRKKKKH
jgi:hypothetical protein